MTRPQESNLGPPVGVAVMVGGVGWEGKQALLPHPHDNLPGGIFFPGPAELQIRCVKLISIPANSIVSRPNPMFDHLRESSR